MVFVTRTVVAAPVVRAVICTMFAVCGSYSGIHNPPALAVIFTMFAVCGRVLAVFTDHAPSMIRRREAN